MSRKTIPRETEKPKKLTRAQKKEIDAVLRKYKGDGKPRTAQATIPYEAIYPDGVCRIDRRTFSKCIAFEDISYQLAQPETRTAIFEHLCDLYNYVDASIHVQLSFLNRKVDPVQYAKSFEIAPQGDDFDDIRAEYTAILQKQLASGNNGIVKTKYLTFTIEADNLKTARARLTRIGLDLLGYFKTMGCVAHVMDGQARLEVLHGIFHPDGEPFRFDWDWLAPSGLSTKDFVAPSSLCFGTAKTFGLGGKYGAVSFLQILAPELSDEMLADFLKTESGILVNLHVQAIDQTEAIKTIKRKITDLDAMKIQEQKKAVRSGYDMDILPSDLATYGEDAKKLLNKLQTRNERLFMLTFLVLNVADTNAVVFGAVPQDPDGGPGADPDTENAGGPGCKNPALPERKVLYGRHPVRQPESGQRAHCQHGRGQHFEIYLCRNICHLYFYQTGEKDRTAAQAL